MVTTANFHTLYTNDNECTCNSTRHQTASQGENSIVLALKAAFLETPPTHSATHGTLDASRALALFCISKKYK